MNIAFITAEMAPLAKVGGLADVAGSLPSALREEGCEVSVFLPRYAEAGVGAPAEAGTVVHQGKVEILPGLDESYRILETRTPESRIPVYLVQNNRFFSRPGIYTDPDTGEEYTDAPLRYLFFCKAALDFMLREGRVPDVLHAHDSHTAPAIVLARKWEPARDAFARTASLLTIHNIAYQGIYPRDVLAAFGAGKDDFFPMSPFEYFGKVNFLKLGILFADAVNTVSERYAREISETEEYGCGLQDILTERAADVHGILNGVDTSVWNPCTDKMIPARFSADSPARKLVNKRALIESCGFRDGELSKPLIGMIGRLVDQKGIDLVVEILPRLAAENLRMAVLGSGLPRYHEIFREAAEKYPDFLKVRIGFDDGLAHLIEAGADMFLMPSRFEPCGLNQMYSMLYGTVPIVRATGGLADTVVPWNSVRGDGTGFLFREYSADSLFSAVREALDVFAHMDTWRGLMKNGMTRDFTWRRSARQYLRLFEKIAARRHMA